MVIKMNQYNEKEIIESIDLAITLLKNKKEREILQNKISEKFYCLSIASYKILAKMSNYKQITNEDLRRVSL